MVVLLITAMSYVMNEYSLEAALAMGVAVALSVFCFVRLKWILYLFIFVCLFSPELPLTAVLGRAAKRPVTLRIEDILLIVLAIAWLGRAATRKDIGLTLRTPLNKPIVFYALACILATVVGIGYGWVGERLGATLFVLKYIQYFVLFFVVLNYIETPRDVRNVVVWGVLTYLAVCMYGLAQIPGGLRPTAFAEYHNEPNTLAGYLLLMIGICSGLMLSAKSARNKLLLASLNVLGVVLLMYTLSRSGWAGLLGVLAVLVFVGRHRYAVLGAMLTLIAGLALFSFEAAWLPAPVRERVDETRGTYEPWPGMPKPVVFLGMKLDPSASERYRSYESAVSTWLDRCGEYWIPVLTGSGVLGGGRFVDGQYVRVLVETGLLGLAAFLSLLVVIWWHVWRLYKELRTPRYKGLALGYLAGYTGLLVHALGANTFIIVRIMEPFFIFTALVVLLPTMERREAQGAEESAEAPEAVRPT